MSQKIERFFEGTKDFWKEKIVPRTNWVAKTTGNMAQEVARKLAIKIKDEAVKNAVKFCNSLAANEMLAVDIEWFKASPDAIGTDYSIFDVTSNDVEPAESLFQKPHRLWVMLFGDRYFIFRYVIRCVKKNKIVSKRNIRALDDEQFLEILELALKVGNSAFILKACGLRGIPEKFIFKGLCSKNIDVVKMIAEKYPEEATSPWVLAYLAESREFELCHKVLGYLGHLDIHQYTHFVKVLIRRTDVYDYEGWKVLDKLLVEEKLELKVLKIIFKEVAQLGYWKNFKEWRASRRSSTFLFIWFVV